MKNKFTSELLRWYRQHGRHDLPWQRDVEPYRVWVSEIMLQQTQVQTVIPYYERFMTRFPHVRSLADAPLDDVLHLWTGLGYYARARNLHKAARIIRDEHNGCFPEDRAVLETLPGIGRSTAAAILALSHNRPHAILDGNVKRVLARYHAVPGWPGKKAVENRLWELARAYTPEREAAAYTQAIMDLGATVCTRTKPACEACPVAAGCEARRLGKQEAFPGRKPRNDKPVRHTCFAILEDSRGRILLQKRPPAGVWGGLWSFPECSPDDDVEAWIKQAFGSTVCGLRREDGLRHTFSHFHLDITPVRAVLAETPAAVRDQSDIRWVHPADELTIGTAAPVKKLIQSLS
ncbi:MAG: A/G-specific adenine glycosylase [Gammaproteobacteria bacterium]